MPLNLPNLDDRRYDDLMAEARALIPSYAPEWTNHNPSDPGITLIELFAYLSEILIYRLNRVTDANLLAFLRLLNGPDWNPSPDKTLKDEIRNTVAELREQNRAVTSEDFERLALAADPRVMRARCLPNRDLGSENELVRGENRPGHLSIMIVPSVLEEDLIKKVEQYLEPRRLLTTRLHVVRPRLVSVGVRITLRLRHDAAETVIRPQVEDSLRKFLDPSTGGTDGRGWPFGRNVYVSEVYELLDRLPGVDYVEKSVDKDTQKPLDELIVSDPARRELVNNELVSIKIGPDELVEALIASEDLTFISPINSADEQN